MYEIDMEVQLLSQLYIKTLVAGVAANEWSEKSPFEADSIPLDGLKDVWWYILNRIPTGITSVQFIKPVEMHHEPHFL